MLATLLLGFILLAALGCALIAGIFLAFSSFVMTALGRLPAGQGAAAMRSINVAVLNPLFLGLFFGAGLLCLVLAADGVMRSSAVGGMTAAGFCRIAAALLYVGGTLVVTMICNVPLNNALAEVTNDSTEGVALWQYYLRRWTAWNHIRTVCAGLGSALLIVSLVI